MWSSGNAMYIAMVSFTFAKLTKDVRWGLKSCPSSPPPPPLSLPREEERGAPAHLLIKKTPFPLARMLSLFTTRLYTLHFLERVCVSFDRESSV